MRKSLGDKRREIPLEREQEILKILADFQDGDTRFVAKDGEREEIVVSRIFPTTHFGFRKITVERPLRLNFQASPERIARLEEEKGFQALASPRRKARRGEGAEPKAGRMQERIRKLLRSRCPDTLVKDRAEFERLLDAAAKKAGIEASRAGAQGHPRRALRARRDGGHLPRQGWQSRARSGAARH